MEFPLNFWKKYLECVCSIGIMRVLCPYHHTAPEQEGFPNGYLQPVLLVLLTPKRLQAVFHVGGGRFPLSSPPGLPSSGDKHPVPIGVKKSLKQVPCPPWVLCAASSRTMGHRAHKEMIPCPPAAVAATECIPKGMIPKARKEAEVVVFLLY